VIYVAGRPHVLRLVDRPLENVEYVSFFPNYSHLRSLRATRISTGDVEDMEVNFKHDVIQEVQAGDGHILLHNEVEERPNVFSIVPLWENISGDDIMMPGNVFHLMAKEGYKVSIHQVIR
jgi:Inositol hexakisphosphate